jgi:hypothetical protein
MKLLGMRPVDKPMTRRAASRSRWTVRPTISRACAVAMNTRPRLLLVTLSVSVLAACTGHDSEYYPYQMTGLDVWVYDPSTGKNFFGGRVEANYFDREAGTRQCGAYAYSTAEQNKLRNWSYVCCTVTSSSDCVTKVR